MNFDALDISILGPAFIAGLIVLATHIPLGQRVLARGIIFIDLAIAQIAALGVIAAQFIGVEEHSMWVQVSAAGAALLGAALLNWSDKRWPHKQEALIGCSFALAASAAILLLANNPHGGEHLKELLVGQILWVNNSQLISAALISACLLAVLWLRRNSAQGFLFYALFAIAITQSVQLVGVYLVFTSLIVPALATDNLCGKRRLISAFVIGISGYAIGLAASAVLDLPSGAVVVWALAICAVIAALLMRKKTG
ncbi:MAG: metal ABC transporter permease [Oceanospirillaceae bacterium]|nr:metal ABC transporter permease [Oceanospirillaceae bacterium]